MDTNIETPDKLPNCDKPANVQHTYLVVCRNTNHVSRGPVANCTERCDAKHNNMGYLCCCHCYQHEACHDSCTGPSGLNPDVVPFLCSKSTWRYSRHDERGD